MRHSIIFALVALSSLEVGFGQGTVKLQFPDKAGRQAWVAGGIPNSVPSDAAKSEGGAEVNLPAKPTDTIFVFDAASGNLAVKSVKDVKGGVWAVSALDYQAVASVRVLVDHNGLPVAGGQVDLNDGKKLQSNFFDTSSKGFVSFFNVKPGSLKLTVHYKVGGKDADPLTQLYDLKLQRTDPEPTITISIADDVATVGAATPPVQPSTSKGDEGSDKAKQPDKASDSNAGAKEAPQGTASPIGRLFEYLVVLALVLGAAYLLLMWVKKNPDRVQTQLEKMGVHVPKPVDPGPPITAQPIKPAPQQKIILGDSEPIPAAAPSPGVTGIPASAAPVSVAATGVPARPRMVRDNGEEVYLQEGATVVGREPGLGISIVDETTISRRHAEVVKTGDDVVVRDLGSTNGTFVNGAKLDGDTVLRVGDAVQFGAVRFKYEV